ncbi:MAG: TrkH family potassium uptake protein, partial [Candidatus Neomarinimicrobiota bacterium]
LMLLGAMLIAPFLFAVFFREAGCAMPFLLTAATSTFLGAVLYFFRKKDSPSTAQAMVICALSWTLLSIAGAVPIVVILDVPWIDGIFESACGFTTTGITMFTGLDTMPRTVLLWRSITQWIGGLGILTFFMAVASQMPGAHRLINAESNKIFSGRPVPGLFNTVKILWKIYISFTAALTIAYFLAGMGVFDAVNHGLTTISTGGFSPHDMSMSWFEASGTGNSILIEYIAIIGMLSGSISFLVHYRVFRGDGIRALWKGSEIRLWWLLLFVFLLAVMGEQFMAGSVSPGNLEQTFRKDLFQVTAIFTTAGYATEELTSPFFGPAARQLFLLMMVIGGCVGSTSSGLKVLRISILLSIAKEEVNKLFRADRAISGTRFEKRLISRDELSRIAGIVFMWFCLLFIGGTVAALLAPEIGEYAAFSGMFSTLSNVGPCFISQQQLMNLHWGVKIVYIIGMLAGRLEFLPVMLLFSGKAWR